MLYLRDKTVNFIILFREKEFALIWERQPLKKGGKVEKGGVGEGAVEAREDREGELADCRVTADAAKSKET